jgi:phenylpropionate dioxygenase-like ring-hydroxylating dioxygenase large terminal subunit
MSRPSTGLRPSSLVTLGRPPIGDRFDFPPYPDSWIQVAWSHELKRGQVKPLRALGRELVMFRGQDGEARVLDAYCPHLGAHLGVGGTVAGNEIRCPFHGWQFDGGGACTRIDYAGKIPPKARLGAWVTRELNGMVFVWHDANGRAPWFELPVVPELGSPEWTRPRHYAYTIRTRWREIVENGVDRAHFYALHRYPEPPALDFSTDGPRFSMTSQVPWRRFGRQVTVRFDIASHGATFQVNRGVGELPFIVLGSQMPIDEETVVHRMTFIVSKKIPFPIRELVVRFVIFSANREFKRDIPIWENKITCPRPVLCDGDGPIGKFRSWARQFNQSEDSSQASAG